MTGINVRRNAVRYVTRVAAATGCTSPQHVPNRLSAGRHHFVKLTNVAAWAFRLHMGTRRLPFRHVVQIRQCTFLRGALCLVKGVFLCQYPREVTANVVVPANNWGEAYTVFVMFSHLTIVRPFVAGANY